MPRTYEACATGERIIRYLRSQYGEPARMLRIEMEAGRLVLRGQAQSYYQKQIWLRGAQHVAGTDDFVDLIEVCDQNADTWHE